MRVRWKDAEATLRDIPAIEVGWRRRKTEVGITGVTAGARARGWQRCGRLARRRAGIPEAASLALGLTLRRLETVGIAHIRGIAAGNGRTTPDEFLVHEKPASVLLDPDVAEESTVAVGLAHVALEDDDGPWRGEEPKRGSRFLEVAFG
jgi:hypothetical protein